MTTGTTPATLALRPRDAARALGISPRTLWGLTAPRGPIPCVRVGQGKRRAVLYSVAELQAWLAQRSTKGGEA
jgi:predicted DNA-binding transcriptional regulator AlpA